MFKRLLVLSLVTVLMTGITSCGGSGGGGSSKSGAEAKSEDLITADEISPEFNPFENTTELDLAGIEKFKLSLFNPSENFHIFYSKDLIDTAILKTLTVYKDAEDTVAQLNLNRTDKVLTINEQGNYKCQISYKNRQIESLKGSCYIHVVLTLPEDAKVEVYYLGALKTKLFYAMSANDFLIELKAARFESSRLEVITKFKDSYKAIGKKPILESQDLDVALQLLPFSRIECLKALQSYVVDRDHLREVIEKRFTHFEKEEALKIVGLI